MTDSNERSSTARGEGWVRVQIPLLAAAVAAPVILRIAGSPGPSRWYLPPPAIAVGVPLLLGGVLLFRAARAVLGKDLIALPAPRDGGRLHRDGIYRRLRHPIYAALTLSLAGWALLWGSVAGLALTAVCAMFFAFKVRAEERFLRARYIEYDEYAARVPAFLPRVWREGR